MYINANDFINKNSDAEMIQAALDAAREEGVSVLGGHGTGNVVCRNVDKTLTESFANVSGINVIEK